jgi:hypothetical protein
MYICYTVVWWKRLRSLSSDAYICCQQCIFQQHVNFICALDLEVFNLSEKITWFAIYLVLWTELSTCQTTNLKRRWLVLFCNYYHVQCICNYSTTLVVILCCNLCDRGKYIYISRMKYVYLFFLHFRSVDLCVNDLKLKVYSVLVFWNLVRRFSIVHIRNKFRLNVWRMLKTWNSFTIDIMTMSTQYYDRRPPRNRYLIYRSFFDNIKSFFDNIKGWTHPVRIILWSNRL